MDQGHQALSKRLMAEHQKESYKKMPRNHKLLLCFRGTYEYNRCHFCLNIKIYLGIGLYKAACPDNGSILKIKPRG